MHRDALIPLAKSTWSEFQRHNSQWLAAALAYFTTFAVAPLIIVLVEIAGLLIGDDKRAMSNIFGYLRQDAGAGAGAIQSIVTATMHQRRSGILAEIVGWVVFVIAAIGFFNSLQFALNVVWDIKPKRTGIWEAICTRWTAFLAILGVALLLLLSIAVNTGLTVMSAALVHVAPFFPTVMKLLDFFVSFGLIWLAIAFMYEFLPETHVEWRDVWIGSGVSAFLFVVGQFLLGWYLGRAGISSGYGAFGSLVVFLIWANYSAQIVLLGAEFAHVYALRYGSGARVTRGEIGTQSPSASYTP